MDRPYLSVVIPAYNEEARIPPTLEQVVAYLSGQSYEWEIVVADDGSTDSTAQAVGKGAGVDSRVRLLSLDHRGKGWAVKNGMAAATGTYRLLCDADLSVPIQQVERLLPPRVPDADIAIGSREAQGAVRFGEPTQRHLMGRIYNELVRRLTVPGLDDTQCGFKCFRSGPATELFDLQTMDGFAFDVEVLYLAWKRGLSIIETGVDWYYRENSKVRTIRDSSIMTLDLAKIRWRHRKTAPAGEPVDSNVN